MTSGLCPECKQGKKVNCTLEYLEGDDDLRTCATQLGDDAPEGIPEPAPAPASALARPDLLAEINAPAESGARTARACKCGTEPAHPEDRCPAHPDTEPEREAPFEPVAVGSTAEKRLMERLAREIKPGDRVTVRLNSTDILTGKVYEADDPSRRRALFVNTTLLRYGNGYPGYYMLLDHTPAAPVPVPTVGERIEEGRRLASERDDLIAQGVDPNDLLIPLAPVGGGDVEARPQSSASAIEKAPPTGSPTPPAEPAERCGEAMPDYEDERRDGPFLCTFPKGHPSPFTYAEGDCADDPIETDHGNPERGGFWSLSSAPLSTEVGAVDDETALADELCTRAHDRPADGSEGGACQECYDLANEFQDTDWLAAYVTRAVIAAGYSRTGTMPAPKEGHDW